jgi:hypothetical protein
VILDLGEDLISCLCLGVKSRALVLNAMAKNLDALKWWWLGVFIAPTTKPTVGVGLLSMGAPDSPVRQPRHPTVRVRLLEPCQPGPPDSLVVHRIGTVHCSVRLLAPALTLRELSVHYSAFQVSIGVDCCAVVVAPLAHRTVRCYTGQSGEL